MNIDVTWVCPNCKSEELSGFQVGKDREEINENVYFVYCSVCDHEFEATILNSKIEVGCSNG